MAVVQQSIVGISSNPDAKPADGGATLSVTGNWADPNHSNVTMSVSGRKVVVYARDANIYKVAAHT